MKRNWKEFTLLLTAFLFGCAEVPITGRSQLNLVPDSLVNSMALEEYQAFLKENKVSTDPQKTAMVREVGKRIAGAVETYFRQQGLASQISGFSWEFNLVENEEKNAWCMPGGKVVVYTGLLPITQDENGLAVVMSHEIAHAVARHGSERMSQGLLYQMGGMALSEAIQNHPAATQQLFMQSYGLGAQIGVLLPYSRLHEKEADRLGLIFMGMAGYNPQTAVDFWKRMAADKSASPPEFLSTHPSDQTRIQAIQEVLPEAMRYYYRATGQTPQMYQYPFGKP
ncbi:MAG TPA: M48 family metallopeptidase [Anaerohalosphaeraceae bacterium]|nr:M48 family metallopeptidase [Anaerohalosphaeraceae bacterium]HOL88475.1 M48 family metallopeptidase [Anaerohalosphaeraceae bacterium]HPP56948.1 M48 family metallopeptidase [Anaerohalosphaeraceae bacterium]